MLARPGLTPGSGLGIAASTSDRATAAVASQATRRSSAVTVSSVTETVIGLGAPGDLHADAVGGADGDLAGARQPALTYAILARAGVGDDAGAARFDGDQCRAERSGDGQVAPTAEIDLGE